MAVSSATARLLQRSFQGVLREQRKSYSTQLAIKEFDEIKFNVPWGHISGKWYGPKTTRPIVGLHGWQDNAGTFDTIAPLLPSHVGFLSIDLPGHGLSSCLPDGCTYHVVDYVTLILTIMREFQWEKISMICHSMSSINGFVFSALFPEKCDMYIGLDILKPVVRSTDVVINEMADRLSTFHKADLMNRNKTEPPSYDFDQLVEKLYEGTQKSVEKDYCHYILRRNIKPSSGDPEKYYFSRDTRLRSTLFYDLPHNVILDLANRITCPHLFIKALQGPYYENKKNYHEMISLLKQKPTFEYHEVDGTHHVHLNEPKKIADLINPFITKHRPE